MKKPQKIVSQAFLCIFLSIAYNTAQAQNGIVSGGNSTIINNEGSISCSIGQVSYSYTNQPEGSIQEGIQQTEIAINNLQIQEHSNIKLSISPNPTKDFCKITLPITNSYQYKLVTASGKIIETGILQNGTTLSLTNVINGVYFLQIPINEQETITYRIVKE